MTSASELKRRFLALRPRLAKMLAQRGAEPIREFAASHLSHPSRQVDTQFAEALRFEVERLHGPDVAAGVSRQLTRCSVVITSDHVGPDMFGDFVQGKLIAAEAARTLGLHYVIVLAGGCVPLSNRFSGYVEWERARVPLFSRKAQSRLVVNATGLGEEQLKDLPNRVGVAAIAQSLVDAGCTPRDVQRFGALTKCLSHATERLQGTLGETSLDSAARSRVIADRHRFVEAAEESRRRFDELFLRPHRHVLASWQLFSDQMSALNRRLWRDARGECGSELRIVHVQLEDVVCRALCNALSSEALSLVPRILIENALRSDVLRAMEGVAGCWGREGQGTQLFWGRDHRGVAVPMMVDGDRLRARTATPSPTLDGLDVRLTPEDLARALRARTIVPAPFLSLVTLMMSGVECVGGINQALDYLPEIWSRLGAVSAKRATQEENDRFQTLRPDLFSCGPTILFDATRSKPRAASMDTLLRFPEATKAATECAARTLTFEQALALSLPHLVARLEPAEARPTAFDFTRVANEIGVPMDPITIR